MVRVTLGGPQLNGFVVGEPAASVRLLLPTPGSGDFVLPSWNGNEFLLPDGGRPVIRTFTPRRVDAATSEVDLDIVVHGAGVASGWAEAAGPGDQAAISGPGRGYTMDAEAAAFLLAGDETAIPAISQLLEAIPAGAVVAVHVEIAHPDARQPLPGHPRATVTWCDLPPGAPSGDALVAAVRGAELPAGVRVWAASEAAAAQRLRRHLSEDRGLPRTEVHVRGYWKSGRSGETDNP